MKAFFKNSSAVALTVLALTLPVSAVTYWSYWSGVEHSSNSVEIGSANGLSSYSLAVGWGNSLSSYSLAVGRYLNSPGSNSLVVGKYNASASGAYFIVGKGSSNGNRSNALEVYSDGTVVIPKKQGSVSMGIYTN